MQGDCGEPKPLSIRYPGFFTVDREWQGIGPSSEQGEIPQSMDAG